MATTLPALLARTLAASLRTMRRRYRKRLKLCQRKFSETAVHDLRIETRRLLALLDLLRALHFNLALRKTRKVLKRRLDAFDELRDTHVCLTLLKPLRREVPEVRGLDPLWRRQERLLVVELRREIRATKQARLQKRLKALEKALATGIGGARRGSDEAPARAALSEAFARVMALRRRIRRNAPSTIHRTRVAFKRFRYMSELLQPLLSGFPKNHLERMRAFQGLMGDIQDLEVLLAAVATAVEAGAFPVADGVRARALLLTSRRAAIDRFLDALDELAAFDPARTRPADSPVQSLLP